MKKVTVISTTSLLVYTSNVDAEGHFKVVGLPTGNYNVTITPVLPWLPVMLTNISVTAGSNTNVGIVTF